MQYKNSKNLIAGLPKISNNGGIFWYDFVSAGLMPTTILYTKRGKQVNCESHSIFTNQETNSKP